jgi:hypothetical protein
VQGEQFLKDAFAPPDFELEQVVGVPDEYNGRTLVKNHVATFSINAGASDPSDEYYICVTPNPSVAFYAGFFQEAAGVNPWNPGWRWQPHPWPDSNTFFSFSDGDMGLGNVSSFRYVSMAFEMISTAPELTVQGSISVVKSRLRLSRAPDSGNLFVVGDEASAGLIYRPDYVGAIRDGIYSIAVNAQPDFEFVECLPYAGVHVPNSGIPSASGAIFGNDSSAYPGQRLELRGLGGVETLFIRVAGAAVTSPFVIRVWATVEYTCAQNSILYPFATSSPPHDPLALETYRFMASQIPVAVKARDNDSFWVRLLRAVAMAGGALGAISGPWGMLARAVGLGAKAASRMV